MKTFFVALFLIPTLASARCGLGASSTAQQACEIQLHAEGCMVLAQSDPMLRDHLRSCSEPEIEIDQLFSTNFAGVVMSCGEGIGHLVMGGLRLLSRGVGAGVSSVANMTPQSALESMQNTAGNVVRYSSTPATVDENRWHETMRRNAINLRLNSRGLERFSPQWWAALQAEDPQYAAEVRRNLGAPTPLGREVMQIINRNYRHFRCLNRRGQTAMMCYALAQMALGEVAVWRFAATAAGPASRGILNRAAQLMAAASRGRGPVRSSASRAAAVRAAAAEAVAASERNAAAASEASAARGSGATNSSRTTAGSRTTSAPSVTTNRAPVSAPAPSVSEVMAMRPPRRLTNTMSQSIRDLETSIRRRPWDPPIPAQVQSLNQNLGAIGDTQFSATARAVHARVHDQQAYIRYSQELMREAAQDMMNSSNRRLVEAAMNGQISRSAVRRVLVRRAAARGETLSNLRVADADGFFRAVESGPFLDHVFGSGEHGMYSHFVQRDFVADVVSANMNGNSQRFYSTMSNSQEGRRVWELLFDVHNNNASRPDTIRRDLRGPLRIR